MVVSGVASNIPSVLIKALVALVLKLVIVSPMSKANIVLKVGIVADILVVSSSTPLSLGG